MTPTFFAKQSDFRNWLEKNHKKETSPLTVLPIPTRPRLVSDQRAARSKRCWSETKQQRRHTTL